VTAAHAGEEGFRRAHLHLPHLRVAIPELTLPETLRVNVWLDETPPAGDRPVDRLRDIGPALAQCLRPLKPEPGAHREVTFIFSFRRDGRLIAPPRLSYSNPPPQSDKQRPFAEAAQEAIADCAPLPFTPRFASAIAGRPFAVRIIDPGNNRKALP
jgi:hypothetical protein